MHCSPYADKLNMPTSLHLEMIQLWSKELRRQPFKNTNPSQTGLDTPEDLSFIRAGE
jgi:hypothetical protein